MSILVHPDKNQDDPDRAQQAFEAVNKAWKTLENEESRKKCMDIIEEAVGRTDIMVCGFASIFFQFPSRKEISFLFPCFGNEAINMCLILYS